MFHDGGRGLFVASDGGSSKLLSTALYWGSRVLMLERDNRETFKLLKRLRRDVEREGTAAVEAGGQSDSMKKIFMTNLKL